MYYWRMASDIDKLLEDMRAELRGHFRAFTVAAFCLCVLLVLAFVCCSDRMHATGPKDQVQSVRKQLAEDQDE